MNTQIKKWIDNNIKTTLKDKNIFITGSNSGIGLELAKECAYLNANIFLLVRNVKKGEEARNIILNEYPNTTVEIIELDLSSLQSINKAYKEIIKHDCDVFINNAGVYRIPLSYTLDNIEITMGTNFIGTFYLNNLINEYFITLKHKVINIFTTSITSKKAVIDYEDFYSLKSDDLIKRYARSKKAINDMYFYYLEKYKDTNIVFSLIHPGAAFTPLITKAYKNVLFQKASKIFMNLIFHTSDKAALVGLYAINKTNNCFVGPKGFLEMSGYPKETKFKRSDSYLKTVLFGLNIIKEITDK